MISIRAPLRQNLCQLKETIFFYQKNIFKDKSKRFSEMKVEIEMKSAMYPLGRSPQICTVYLCVTLKNQIINPCSNANSLITRLVCVPTTAKTILGHLPDLL